jgi:hypothetical protein
MKTTYHFDDSASRASLTLGGTLIPDEEENLGGVLIHEVQGAPAQSLLVDLRALTAQGEVTPEIVAKIASRWEAVAAEQSATVRFAIIAGAFRAQAEYFAEKFNGSALDVRVFATKADAIRWLDAV